MSRTALSRFKEVAERGPSSSAALSLPSGLEPVAHMGVNQGPRRLREDTQ